MTDQELANLRAEWRQLSCPCERLYGEPLLAEIRRLKLIVRDQQAFSAARQPSRNKRR